MTRARALVVALVVLAAGPASAKPHRRASAGHRGQGSHGSQGSQGSQGRQGRGRAKHPAPTPIPDPDPEIEMEPEPGAASASRSAGGSPAGADAEAVPLGEPAGGPPTAGDRASTAGPADSTARRGWRRLYVRAGVAVIKPLSSSRPMELADIDGAASLAVENGSVAGSGARVGSATVPSIIVGFRLTDHLALETLLGLPFTVKFEATGTLANESLAPMALGIPTGVEPLGPELGEAKAAPPLVTLVYKLRPPAVAVRPFVGAGAAVLFATNAHVTNRTLVEVSQPTMHVSPAPGVVLQAGLEARLGTRWFARLDAKYIALMLIRAEVDHIQVKTPGLPLYEQVEVGTAKMSVWVNPLIVQGAFGLDF